MVLTTLKTLENGKIFKTLGVININQIDQWEKLKDKLKWVNAVFNDSENRTMAKHFAFGFRTVSLQDILKFEFSLLDDEGKLITFISSKQKVPILNFTIQIVK